MENASKALIIAGAILIAILLISTGIYLYNKSGSMAISNANASSQEMLIMKFNKEYTMYEDMPLPYHHVHQMLLQSYQFFYFEQGCRYHVQDT